MPFRIFHSQLHVLQHILIRSLDLFQAVTQSPVITIYIRKHGLAVIEEVSTTSSSKSGWSFLYCSVRSYYCLDVKVLSHHAHTVSLLLSDEEEVPLPAGGCIPATVAVCSASTASNQ